MKCQAVPPKQMECLDERGERSVATHKVTFVDQDVAHTCENCALRLRQTIGHTVKIERIK